MAYEGLLAAGKAALVNLWTRQDTTAVSGTRKVILLTGPAPAFTSTYADLPKQAAETNGQYVEASYAAGTSTWATAVVDNTGMTAKGASSQAITFPKANAAFTPTYFADIAADGTVLYVGKVYDPSTGNPWSAVVNLGETPRLPAGSLYYNA